MKPLKGLKYFLFFFPLFLAASDFEIWVDGQTQLPVKGKVTFEYRYSYRSDQNASRLYYIYYQGKLILPMGENWSIAPGYRQVFLLLPTASGGDKWVPQYQPIFDFIKRGKLRRADWVFTHRFQYDTPNKRWEIRDRIQIKLPKISFFRPVWYEEIFYDLFTEIVQHRHYFGCEAEFPKDFRFRVAYLLRYLKLLGTWNQSNVLFFEFFYTY